MGDTIRIAAVQAKPEFMDLNATIDKACALIAEAGREGASLAVFPEAFVPGYPLWAWFIPASQTHPLRDLYSLLHRNSVAIPDAATDRLCAAAAEASVTVAIGVNERNAEASDGTLLNTLLWIGADGRIMGRHRKLMPTAGEKLVWGFGDGSDIDVYDAGFARLGGLICWENYMPLARFALYASGVQVYVAPTWDRGEPWLSGMRHIAKEGRCVVVGCGSAFHRDDVPEDLEFKDRFLDGVEGWINTGDSVIVDPDGKIIAGPAREEETILYADVRRDQLIGPRWQLDAAGHYGRPDVFRLVHDRRPKPHLERLDDADSAPVAEDGDQ